MVPSVGRPGGAYALLRWFLLPFQSIYSRHDPSESQGVNLSLRPKQSLAPGFGTQSYAGIAVVADIHSLVGQDRISRRKAVAKFAPYQQVPVLSGSAFQYSSRSVPRSYET